MEGGGGGGGGRRVVVEWQVKGDTVTQDRTDSTADRKYIKQ